MMKFSREDAVVALEEIRSWYEFRDFGHFLEVYRNAVRVLCDDDFALLAVETIRTPARQNVRQAEVNFSLCDHLERDIPAEVVFAGLEQGRKHVEAEHDITIRWLPDFAGDSGVAAGEAALEAVLAHGPPSVLVTLNSNGPPMFGTELTGEYRTAAAMGLTPAALAQLARNGVHASFAEPARKTTLVAEIEPHRPRTPQHREQAKDMP